VWAKLQAYLPDIHNRYISYPAGQKTLDQELALVAITLEKRVEEVIGLVEIVHSQYYSTPEVIDSIADFIAFGLPPQEVSRDSSH